MGSRCKYVLSWDRDVRLFQHDSNAYFSDMVRKKKVNLLSYNQINMLLELDSLKLT